MTKLPILSKLFSCGLFASALASCHPAAIHPYFYFNATGEVPHSSSVTRTRFGAVHVWVTDPDVIDNDVALIAAEDATSDAAQSDGAQPGMDTKYVLLAPRSSYSGNALQNFNLTRGISLPDTDARELIGVLNTIAKAPARDSTYYHYTCDAQLTIAPTTVISTPRGYNVSTAAGTETTWIATCDVSYYLGSGTLTLADGSSWSQSITLDSGSIARLIPPLDSAISDIEPR